MDKHGLQPFTVVGFFEETGQITCMKVSAKDKMNAFAVAAQQKPNSSLTMVVAIAGHQDDGDSGMLAFPGEGIVDSETILEQPDVFGSPEQPEEA